MRLKYLLTTGLLSYASCASAWILDESISVPSTQTIAASESIQPDFFESAEKNNHTLEEDVPAQTFAFNDILPTTDHDPITVISTPKIPETLAPVAVIEPVPKLPLLEKKISSLTVKDVANQRYNAALQKLELGMSTDTEKLFIEILNDYPPHTLSRVQLSKMAILNNDYGKAEKWLTEQPDYFSNHPAYLQTLALIYERTGRKQEALKILEKVPTAHRKNVEFYSLLASLYQQTGNHVLAQRYYHGLLNKEPDNTTWLLGLSISLDSGGEKKMALSYYKKILEQGGLDANTLSFVRNRFDKLSKK